MAQTQKSPINNTINKMMNVQQTGLPSTTFGSEIKKPNSLNDLLSRVKATNTIVLDNKTVISVDGLMFKEKYMSANMEEVYSYYEQEPDYDLGII